MCDTQRKKVVDAIEARQDNIFSAIRQVTPVCHSKPILNRTMHIVYIMQKGLHIQYSTQY